MIEPTHVLLLRHGQTAWNAEQRLQGQLDVPLDTVGQRQVAQMAAVLAGEDLAAIYSSDLKRALDTALALARVTGLPVIQDKALRERGFGRLEGLTYAEVDALWPDDALRWRRREPDFGPGGGETLRAFYARSVAAVTRLALPHPGQTLAVVAHGGVLDCGQVLRECQTSHFRLDCFGGVAERHQQLRSTDIASHSSYLEDHTLIVNAAAHNDLTCRWCRSVKPSA